MTPWLKTPVIRPPAFPVALRVVLENLLEGSVSIGHPMSCGCPKSQVSIEVLSGQGVTGTIATAAPRSTVTGPGKAEGLCWVTRGTSYCVEGRVPTPERDLAVDTSGPQLCPLSCSH